MTRDLPVQFNSICGSPKHGDIYDCKSSFLERAKLFIFILKIIETTTSQNFQQLKQKYLPLLRQKMHKPDGLLVLGFLQARDRFYWPRAPDHRLISKTALFDLLKSLYSDTNILSKYIPSLQKKL
jgi:hypothetical protein